MKRIANLFMVAALAVIFELLGQSLSYADSDDDQSQPWTSFSDQIAGEETPPAISGLTVKPIGPQTSILNDGYQLQLNSGQDRQLQFSVRQELAESDYSNFEFGGANAIQISVRGETTLPNLSMDDRKTTLLQNKQAQPNFTSFFPQKTRLITASERPKIVRLRVKVPKTQVSGTFTGNIIITSKNAKKIGVLSEADLSQKIPVTMIINHGQPKHLNPIRIQHVLTPNFHYDDGFLQATNVHGLRFVATNHNPINIQTPQFRYTFYQSGKVKAQTTQAGQAIAANETFRFVPQLPYLKPGHYRLKVEAASAQGKLGQQYLSVHIPAPAQAIPKHMPPTPRQQLFTFIGLSFIGVGIVAMGYLLKVKQKLGT
ncbi:hypothetical protein ACNAN0_11875 [Agrilactobacillus fermenti]|uniref:hypothetical protein n=1 Tax=Agrilactobacillus fermenti TaxID=2586909 RepID=UPI003A5C3867